MMAISTRPAELGRGTQERLAATKQRLLGATPRIGIERARLVTDFYREHEHLPTILKRAGALEQVLMRVPVHVWPDELIVGAEGPVPGCAQLYPDYSFHTIDAELDQFDARIPHTGFVISAEDKRELRERIFPYWKGKTLFELGASLIPPKAQAAMDAAVFTSIGGLHGGIGHTLADYPDVLVRGIDAIARDADEAIANADLSDPDQIQKIPFWQAVGTVCRAVVTWARRHADEARRLAAEEPNPERRAELLEIARICDKVPAGPAETFHEALQSLWFTHLAVLIESVGVSVSMGRFDQYMSRYYENDLAKGRLTRDQAKELLESLWIKFNEINRVFDKRRTDLVGPYTSRQAMTVGGVTPAGLDATNELTYLCLEVQQSVGLHQPSLCVRIHPTTPDEFLLLALKVVRMGTGLPALFNDEAHVWAMLNRGASLDDARDYAIVGCVEPSLPGKTWGNCSASKFNLPKCLILALHDGVDPATGRQVGPATGDPRTFTRFEQVLDAYRRQVAHFVGLVASVEHCIEIAHAERAPIPLMSALIKDCVGRGKDVTAGGAHYNMLAPQATGQTNVGDSLAAIKKLAFDDQALTMAQLLEALDQNFAGQEKLRQQLLRAPKYGNDDDAADLLVREALRVFTEAVARHRNIRGGHFHAGAFPSLSHVSFGKIVGATPDGRKAGEPFATGVTPASGRDVNGTAAAVNSAGKLDYLSASNGTVLTQWFHPSALADDRGLSNLAAVVRSYFDQRGQEIQFNVVSADLLREAQKHPEQYRSLVVRVTGWSAFFVGLEKDVQDEIIARTEHAHV